LKISCKKGFVNIISLQAEGKNRMEIQKFLRGFKIESYTIPVS
jgi:methionyl-tRNA formyltransferase